MLDDLIMVSGQVLARPVPEFRRFLFDRISREAKLIGIMGARGAGKTTLMLQLAAGLAPAQTLYLSVDHPMAAGVDLFGLGNAFFHRGGEVLLIDEIHKLSNFESHLKALHDTTDLKIIFSGSSALHLAHARADLSRRALVYRLPSLSLREYMALGGYGTHEAVMLPTLLGNHAAIATRVTQGGIKPLAVFEEYLRCGAYPFFAQGRADYLFRLEESLRQSIEGDLPAVFEGIAYEEVEKIKRLLRLLGQTPPSGINISKLAKEGEVSREFIYKSLYRLSEAGLIRMIGGKSAGGKVLAKPDKLYLENPNLFYALSATPDTGALREAFFAAMLESAGHRLSYPPKGDFLVDERWLFEVGGPSKGFAQIADQPASFLAVDGQPFGVGNKIPLWMFGMLY